ncbi:MAG: helix-turn-helix domain-containing protein [Clostridiales bacterium]|nr:helix-turn-helix domain-containing protein [Clostridiales bacterium]
MKRVRKITPEGKLIKMLMAQNNLTVRELGRRVGKADATICDVISGKNRSRKTLNMILDALKQDGMAGVSEYRQLLETFLGKTDSGEDAEDNEEQLLSPVRQEMNDQEGDSLVVIDRYHSMGSLVLTEGKS